MAVVWTYWLGVAWLLTDIVVVVVLAVLAYRRVVVPAWRLEEAQRRARAQRDWQPRHRRRDFT